jgi:hypothetical protein
VPDLHHQAGHPAENGVPVVVVPAGVVDVAVGEGAPLVGGVPIVVLVVVVPVDVVPVVVVPVVVGVALVPVVVVGVVVGPGVVVGVVPVVVGGVVPVVVVVVVACVWVDPEKGEGSVALATGEEITPSRHSASTAADEPTRMWRTRFMCANGRGR